ncbi:hypothetical protein RUM43_014537 [Polyplax serrata]|uniref:Uncharacterized protein n=1 Tax=Polyplax serrata TaxID=468196 RepID=A0AAN8S5Y7_POLSC
MKKESRSYCVWMYILFSAAVVPLVNSTGTDNRNKVHSREKRLLWLTTDGRLALPPGTTLVIAPTLGMPFVRYPPDGFLSNMSISLPFTIQFDKLGLTDNQNPYGVLPPTLERSMGRAAGVMMADYIAKVLSSRRHKREIPKAPPEANFHGGERALLYTVVEDFLSNFGMDGKACLLRAICEVHGHSMQNFGFLGEILQLFFTASRSPFADALYEYVEAEQAGYQDGECWKYYKNCSKSLFSQKDKNKFEKDFNEEKESADSKDSNDSDINTIDVDYTKLNRL